MAYLHEPSRGGTRGGKDQFTWKNVEVDKYRENYLANSLMAPVGRWQKGKDLTCPFKANRASKKVHTGKNFSEQKTDPSDCQEMAAVKLAENEAMARALGLKSGPSIKPMERLSKEEIADVCKRRTDDDEYILPEERLKGMGFKSTRMGSSSTISKDGVMKFEQDPLEIGKNDRLVLKTDTSHQRISSDQLQSSSITNISTQNLHEQDLEIPAKIMKKKKMSNKKKKHSHIQNSSDESKKHDRRKMMKKKKKHKMKKMRSKSSSECSSEEREEWEKRQTGSHVHHKEKKSCSQRDWPISAQRGKQKSKKEGKQAKRSWKRSASTEDSELEQNSGDESSLKNSNKKHRGVCATSDDVRCRKRTHDGRMIRQN